MNDISAMKTPAFDAFIDTVAYTLIGYGGHYAKLTEKPKILEIINYLIVDGFYRSPYSGVTCLLETGKLSSSQIRNIQIAVVSIITAAIAGKLVLKSYKSGDIIDNAIRTAVTAVVNSGLDKFVR